MEETLEDRHYTYLVVADDDSRWGDVCEQAQEERNGPAVKLVHCSLSELIAGKVDRSRCDIVVAKFEHGHEILSVQSNYPLVRIVLGVAGEMTNQVLELLTVAPIGIVRIPPLQHEVQELLNCPKITSINSFLRMSMRASFTSREVGSLKMVFPLGEWLVTAGIIGDREWRALHVAFQEALSNSLEHGNLELLSEWKDDFDAVGRDRYSLEKTRRLKLDEYGGRLLQIETSYNGVDLVITIEDQGKGFDVKNATERAPSVDACHGRGFSLITAYMDTVTFNSNGTKITMKKCLR